MKKPSLRALRKAVNELAKKYPDAVYRGPLDKNGYRACKYDVGKAGPGYGCLIGQGMAALGVDKETLKSFNGETVNALYSSCKGEDVNWLGEVQWRQDIGDKWSDAISWANNEVRRPR